MSNIFVTDANQKDNCVLVPPVMVGDFIYIVDENSNEFTGIDCCCVERIEYNGSCWLFFHDKDEYAVYEESIGKTVFLSEDEAKRAVEKRGNE